jgi:glycosyltransferase involved in cell wall biosynthesis
VKHAHPDDLHLLYTGRFYSFRDPSALLEAVLAVKSVRLTIVGPQVKPEYLAYVARSDGRIAFLGEQSHAKVLKLQHDCDVLVNIGNALDAQIPGKLFEYLGTGKPILHCQSTHDDPALVLLEQWRCGWACRNDPISLQHLLADLSADPRQAIDAVVSDSEAIARHGWSRLGAELFKHCERLMSGTSADGRS